MTNYQQEALKVRSEKITLVMADAVKELKIFTFNGVDWERSVDQFVVGVKNSGVALSYSEVSPLPADSYFYNPMLKKLFVNVGSDPKTQKISVTYRFFFSNAPFNLPCDLEDGVVVEWQPLLPSNGGIGQIGQQLDEENTGIVLESSSSLTLINTGGFFDPIYDTLIWENQNIRFFSWFPNIPIEDSEQLFEGVIESKSYTENAVVFKVKDFVYKLKNQVDLGFFTEADGVILPSLMNTPKRRIYGQVDNMKCVSLDAILDGYNLTGLISGSLSSTTLNGSGSLFLDEASPSDELFVFVNDIEYKLGIESVDTNLQITLTKPLEISFSNAVIRIKPQYSWRKKNRTWHLAGHKLRAPSVNILIVQSANTYLVDSSADFYAGDEILINGFQTNIRRISGNKIITTTNVSPLPNIGDTIEKRPVKAAFFGSKSFVYDRDYHETNITEATITFDSLAEFNISEQRKTGATFVFTNGSRTITTSANVDLRTIVKPRDWIRSINVARTTWYEVLSVSEQAIVLRTAIAITGGPFTEEAYYKNIEPIDENSLITVNCLGMEISNQWMRTASDAVRHLILNDADFSVVNESTFAKAKSECNYTLSMCLPKSLGQSAPLVRDVITDINNSVFGSLYGDSSQNISFSILNSRKPELSNIIRDDDLAGGSPSIVANQKIANKVIVNYRPFIDIFTGDDAVKTYVYESKFVNDLIGIKNTIERTLFIYEEDKAVIMAQRIALFNSLSSSSVTLKAKMIFAKVSVNDKIYLELDRLYNRYAGLDRRKLGSVTGVKKDGYGTEITVTDLGNIFNRIPSVAPSDASDFSNATSDEKMKWGYILDNDTLTPDPTSETGLGSGIIG